MNGIIFQRNNVSASPDFFPWRYFLSFPEQRDIGLLVALYSIIIYGAAASSSTCSYVYNSSFLYQMSDEHAGEMNLHFILVYLKKSQITSENLIGVEASFVIHSKLARCCSTAYTLHILKKCPVTLQQTVIRIVRSLCAWLASPKCSLK